MKTMKPAGGINQPTSTTVERVAKITVDFLTWQRNLIKILYCAFSSYVTSLSSTMRRATLQSAISRCGEDMSIRYIHAAIIHF